MVGSCYLAVLAIVPGLAATKKITIRRNTEYIQVIHLQKIQVMYKFLWKHHDSHLTLNHLSTVYVTREVLSPVPERPISPNPQLKFILDFIKLHGD